MLQNKIANIVSGFREGLTGFITTIGGDHSYIHDGLAFSVVYEVSSLIAGAKTYVGITTPNEASGKFIHMRPTGFSSTDSGIVGRIYEGLAYTGGDAHVPFNRNRLASNVCICSASTNVTATPGAELIIAAAAVGSGGNAVSSAGGGGASEANEIVLKQDTAYVVEIENIGASTTKGIITLFWYEETAGIDS